MKRRVRIGGAVTLLIALSSWAALAQLSRAAMVTQLSGGGQLAGKPIRTLQVLAEGSEISVPSGANLRLVYLQSGHKEALSGPLKFRVGQSGSKKLEGAGKLVEEAGGGSNTRLPKSDNLRRMGGSLQARRETVPDATPDQGPTEVLAMLGEPAPPLPPPPPPPPPPAPGAPSAQPAVAPAAPIARTVGIPGEPLRPYMLPLLALKGESYLPLAWKGGQGPFTVTVVSEGAEVCRLSGVQERQIQPEELRLIPGKPYELRVDGQGARDHLAHPFMILLPSEAAAYESEVTSLGVTLGGKPRDLALARIAVAEEWGLWLEALEAARGAAAETPDDAGVQAALGRALFNLGCFEEAEVVLRRAQKLEARRP